MYKFYTIITAALFASSLTGVASSPQASLAGRDAVLRGQSEKVTPAAEPGVVTIGGKTYSLDMAVRPMSRAGEDEPETPDGSAEITVPEIITEAPAGTDTPYIRNCRGWFSSFGTIYQMQDNGGAVHLITDTGDGYVYMNNPVSGFAMNVWVKGTMSADGTEISFSGAQKVNSEYYMNNEYNYYAVPLEFVITNTDSGTGWFFPTDKPYKLGIENGHFVSLTNDLIFGLCQIQEDGTFRWLGYGDFAIDMVEQTEVAPTFPSGVDAEQWTVKYTGGAHYAQVAVSGDKMYVKGILPDLTDGVAVGTIKDGKVTFEVGQYLGENTNLHYAYLYGSTIKNAWNENYGDYVMTVFATRKAEFDYVAAEKLINNCEGLAIANIRAAETVGDDYIPVASAISSVSAQYLVRDSQSAPSSPTGITFFAFSDQEQYGYVNFSLSNLDVKGCLLDESRLYYCTYFDGELFEFMPDEYASLEEPTQLIPYNYSDFFDFDAMGYDHTYYYYADGLETIGIQAVYNNEDDMLFASNLVTFPLNSGLDRNLDVELTVKDVTYYDLQGRKVDNPVAGLYVKRTTYTNGTSCTVKTIIK